MRLQLLSAVPSAVSLTSVGFHYTSNMAFVYGIFGFDFHLLTVAVALLGIHVFIFLRELGRVRIEGWAVNFALNTIDTFLQGLVLAPFFITTKGSFINLAEVDGGFWLHVFFVAASIALLRFVVYLFVHCTFIDFTSKENPGTSTLNVPMAKVKEHENEEYIDKIDQE